jgi:hypothetical protein
MRMTCVTGVVEVTSVPEAGIICNWNVLGTAAWKRKSAKLAPNDEVAVSVVITKFALSAGRSKENSTRRPFSSYAVMLGNPENIEKSISVNRIF